MNDPKEKPKCIQCEYLVPVSRDGKYFCGLTAQSVEVFTDRRCHLYSYITINQAALKYQDIFNKAQQSKCAACTA